MIGGQKQTGFTIVELLIVIVVIAVLAAITVVSYNGIQNRAKDSQADTGLSSMKKLLELYKSDTGAYPSVCAGGDNAGCDVNLLASVLTPTYTGQIPESYGIYQYVRGTGGSAYAIYMRYYTKPNCKAGVNVSAGWWGAGLPTC